MGKIKKTKKLNIVLAGQANVGKSVIFNYLTGLHQHIGNWAGKTVEKAEGTLYYKGYRIDVLDLPGIYSLSTFSLEEIISREYIAFQKPDFIINVVDATRLERNLIFTLQLLELERPMVVSLNMINLSRKKGMRIDIEKLEKILNVKVIETEAIYGKGINKCLEEGISLANRKNSRNFLRFGKETEERLEKIVDFLKDIEIAYPKRWTAIKLLEKDKQIRELIKKKNPEILPQADKFCLELESMHGHDSALVIADERCGLVSQIIREVLRIQKPQKISLEEKLDNLTGHKIWGYPIMFLILASVFVFIFQFGNYFSSLLESLTVNWQVGFQNFFGSSLGANLLWSGVESVIALMEIVLPFIFPFYLCLFILEDWGYLARVAFLTDNLMHKMGVHGKACIPLILGFGCNTPACLSCRIMETQRERFLTGFLVTFVPCSAVGVIVLGLVGRYVGMEWVLGLYFLVILIAIILGFLVSKILPGEPVALIMDMPDYKLPNLKNVFLQTWGRLREFIFIAGPIIILSGVIIEALYISGGLRVISDFLAPITVGWLGLPSALGVLLILGILRKELILVMLATLLGTTDFGEVLSPEQIITLTLVSMLYIPCVATIAAFWKEFGWKKTLGVTVFKIILAILIGGLVYRFLI
ncbi:MAG: ferrous iron transport protein B [Candidatus Moraniibacteriota bacterium]